MKGRAAPNPAPPRVLIGARDHTHPVSRDEGSTHVLEAVIVATIMIASVAFVVSFEPGSGGDRPERVGLEQSAADALAILYDTPSAGGGGTLLDELLLECLQGDCSRIDARLGDLLPEGASFALYLGNGHDVLPVHEPRQPSGESVTARHLLQPSWSYEVVAPAMSFVNPAEDALPVATLPVFHSNVVTPGGSALKVVVHGSRVGDGASYVLKSAATTYAGAATDASTTPAASLFFHDGSGAPLATRDVRALTLGAGLLPTGATVPVYVRLDETASVRVPAGAVLDVHLPRGWTAVASQPLNAPHWRILANATDAGATADGSTVRAVLLHDVSGAAVDLRLDATYHGDANDHYAFAAELSRGASASASHLVRADTHGAAPPFELPGVHLSAPRPMGAGAPTTWTLAAHAPQKSGVSLSTLVRVERVEIIEESGAPIFGAVAPISGAAGAWTSEGDRLVWTGTALVSGDAPLALAFRVHASGAPSPEAPRDPFTSTLDVAGWHLSARERLAPGLHRALLLPAGGGYAGYDGTNAGVSETHTIASDSVYRASALRGSGSYAAASVTPVKDALFGSHVSVARREVPVGGVADIAVEAQAVMYEVAQTGATPSVTARFYPPWAAGERVPIFELDLFDGSLLDGTLLDEIDSNGDGVPEQSDVGRFNISAPIPPGWLYGPYLVEVEVSWVEDVSADVGGETVTQSVSRTARLHDYFVATPPDGVMPSSPVYDVHLVTWIGDWG